MLYNTWTNVIIILNKLIQVVNQNPSFTDIGTTKVHIGKLSFTWHFLLLSQYMAKYGYASAESDQPLPIHLCCFLAILFMFIVFWCIITYDHVLYSLFHNLKLIVMECHFLLVLDLHRLSSHFCRQFPSMIPLQGKDSLHSAWRTPRGKHIFTFGFFLFFIIDNHSMNACFLLWAMDEVNGLFVLCTLFMLHLVDMASRANYFLWCLVIYILYKSIWVFFFSF